MASVPTMARTAYLPRSSLATLRVALPPASVVAVGSPASHKPLLFLSRQTTAFSKAPSTTVVFSAVVAGAGGGGGGAGHSRFFTPTLTRLKLNHGRFESHLFKIGCCASPYCSCDNSSICDLNHLILACPRYEQHRTYLFQVLKKYTITYPISIAQLLSLHHLDIERALINFIKISQIKI